MPEYFISTDPTLLDHDFIAKSLQSTYWAAERPKEIIDKSLTSSLCFGAYITDSKVQVGFARVVTDSATFAWICDVVVDPAHRARGLGKRLMQEIVGHPELSTAMMILGTRDAHGLYERYGFQRREMMQRRIKPAPNPASEQAGSTGSRQAPTAGTPPAALSRRSSTKAEGDSPIVDVGAHGGRKKHDHHKGRVG